MDTKAIIADLRAQRDRIDSAITALEALNGTGVAPAKPDTRPATAPTATKRVISAKARQRMAEAQQKRWAKKKRAVKADAKKTGAVVPAAVKPAKAAPVASTSVKKVGKPMSEATKKRLSELAKKRWAAKKAAAKKV